MNFCKQEYRFAARSGSAIRGRRNWRFRIAGKSGLQRTPLTRHRPFCVVRPAEQPRQSPPCDYRWLGIAATTSAPDVTTKGRINFFVHLRRGYRFTPRREWLTHGLCGQLCGNSPALGIDDKHIGADGRLRGKVLSITSFARLFRQLYLPVSFDPVKSSAITIIFMFFLRKRRTCLLPPRKSVVSAWDCGR